MPVVAVINELKLVCDSTGCVQVNNSYWSETDGCCVQLLFCSSCKEADKSTCLGAEIKALSKVHTHRLQANQVGFLDQFRALTAAIRGLIHQSIILCCSFFLSSVFDHSVLFILCRLFLLNILIRFLGFRFGWIQTVWREVKVAELNKYNIKANERLIAVFWTHIVHWIITCCHQLKRVLHATTSKRNFLFLKLLKHITQKQIGNVPAVISLWW